MPGPPPSAPRVALVTGAGRRVGAAIARALGAAGWDVAIHFHASAEPAARLSAELLAVGRRTALCPGDLSVASECGRVVQAAEAALGGLDLVVSSAGLFERATLDEATPEAFDRAMALHVRAPLFLAQAAAPSLRARRGSIVVVTCTSATHPYRGFLPYVVSKGAAQKLVRALAVELAPDVRVNAVAPGTVLAPPGYDEAAQRALADRTLVGHLGTPEDVARAVLYLADAPFVTGHEILVDGGVALSVRHSGEA